MLKAALVIVFRIVTLLVLIDAALVLAYFGIILFQAICDCGKEVKKDGRE